MKTYCEDKREEGKKGGRKKAGKIPWQRKWLNGARLASPPVHSSVSHPHGRSYFRNKVGMVSMRP
jgi:hypothetical protein